MAGVSMGGHKHQIEIALPKEFLELCEHDLVSVATSAIFRALTPASFLGCSHQTKQIKYT
jgi:hypothetical protein